MINAEEMLSGITLDGKDHLLTHPKPKPEHMKLKIRSLKRKKCDKYIGLSIFF